ncbi:MFS transporter [Horticoccus luteus]|uniref:MFS transporter n=1 Tax=Horticoccus luteus TaxID=2862869 RepID=A0A8F9TTK0_9BACT|nr:MFS transporter [Horticoccus luteus]QYM77796.1 MFS transporter [Horticoccus luteus]
MSHSAASTSPGRFRWVICSLLFFSVAVNYIDRLVLAILKNDLSRDLGWTEADYGWITAAFSFAYAFGYLFGGRLMDRWGVKKGLPIFVLLWSCAATAHGLCGFIAVGHTFSMHLPWFSWAEKSVGWILLTMPMTAAGFMLARIALGLAEGGNFPGAIKVVAEWFPVKERALATGLFNAGTNVGAIICPIGVPWLYAHLGWQSTFYITGGAGFVWVIAWWLVYDSPEQARHLSAAERDYIREGQPPAEAVPTRMPWLPLLRHRAVWAYVIASILAGPAWGFYQFFVPDFLTKRFGLTTQAVGWWTGAFFALAAVGGIAGGWLAGWLLERGWTVNGARKISLLICAVAVVPVFFAPYAGTVWLAVAIVGLAGSAHQGWSANLFSVVSDTMPREAISSVVGLGGFTAYFTGGFVNGFTGEILQRTGSYVPVFAYFSGMYLLSLFALQLLVPRLGVATVRTS